MIYKEFIERMGEDIDDDTLFEFDEMYASGSMDFADFCRMVKPFVIAQTRAHKVDEEMQECYDEFDSVKNAININNDDEAILAAAQELIDLKRKWGEFKAKKQAIFAERDAKVGA